MKRFIFSVRVYSLAFVLLLGVGFYISISANDDKNGKGEEHGTEKGDSIVKIPVELVVLDVAVIDQSRHAISGLAKDQFKIFEDKVQQSIEYFSCETVPISVGFVIDTSGSMRKKLPTVIQAAKTMVRMARPGDEFFVVQFREKANLVEEFTTNLNEVEEALNEITANQGTALLDAIYVSADYAAREAKHRRKALVVISDGDERDSFYKSEQLLDYLRELDVQIYLIGFPDELADSTGFFHTSPRAKAVKLLNKIAEESGGAAFVPSSLYDVCVFTEDIGRDLHSQYTIGYFSSNEKHDGSWRRIQVKLEERKEDKKKDPMIRARKGYFAINPAEKPQ
ncbi:MAG: VWA domain-containing protein [Acidobacteriota bacterium]